MVKIVGMPVEHRAHVLSRVVCLLDADRVRVLEILLIFLRELAKASATTLMNAHNLAIVFAPNILRSGTDNPGQVITDAKATLEIVNLLLTDSSITAPKLEELRTGIIGGMGQTIGTNESSQLSSQGSSHANSTNGSSINGTNSSVGSAAEFAAKSEKFKRTMRENYQAIRKDSTRKLEQASRKSRVSISEFNKKMEVLSQRILDGEIDPALFDEAALKFMDPQLIAQFSGQNEPLVTGHRANRQARNANRNVAIMGSGANFNDSLNSLIEEEGLSSTLNASSDSKSSIDGANGSETKKNLSSSSGAEPLPAADSQPSSPLSPRGVIPKTKPSLQRAISANSATQNVENQVGFGLQRHRSNQLAKDSGDTSNTSSKTTPSGSALASAATPMAILTHSGNSPNFSLGTHRPVTVTAHSATSVPAAQVSTTTTPPLSLGSLHGKSSNSEKSLGPEEVSKDIRTSQEESKTHEEKKTSAEKRQMLEKKAAEVDLLSPRSAGAHRAALLSAKTHRASDPSYVSSPGATNASVASNQTSNLVAVSSSSSLPAATAPTSPRALSDEEDLDDIMGDLLKPHDHASGPESSKNVGAPDNSPQSVLKRNAAQKTLSLNSSLGNSSSSTNDEAATLVTLELIELMLGGAPSELPEIVVPTDAHDSDTPIQSPKVSSRSSHHANDKMNMRSSAGEAADDGEEICDEEVVETVSAFPTTGLFSSPLIASGTPRRSSFRKDTSGPSMDDINQILKGE